MKPRLSPYDSHDLTPLENAIAHWERLATGRAHPRENILSNHCALCLNYNHEQDNLGHYNCQGCPVFEHTGQTDCSGTPYGAASRAYYNNGANSPEFRAAAQLELNFLKTLRPTT